MEGIGRRQGRRRFDIGVVAAALLMALWMGIGQVSATEIFTPELTVVAGEAVAVPIKLDQVDNLAGVKIVLAYDKELLTFTEAEKTRHTSPLMHIVNDKTPGRLIVVMAGARGIKGKDFGILVLSFRASPTLKEPVEKTSLKIEEVQLMSDQLKEFEASIRTGPITIIRKAADPAAEAGANDAPAEGATRSVPEPVNPSTGDSAPPSPGDPPN